MTLDTQGEEVNAIEGGISFPSAILELKEIKDGNSIINFWIEKPAQKGNGLVQFSGVIPGGFNGVLSPYYKGGKPGRIFGLVFSAKKENVGAIEVKSASVLLNDGKGTPANVQISNFSFVAIRIPIREDSWAFPRDADPPELFTPEIANDPNIFDDRWFLVFAAQDKVSGIDHYEVQETRGKEPDKSKWNTAQSPLILKDQSRASYIFVKAIDRAGNERIVVVMPAVRPWYRKPIVDMILTLVVLVVLILIARWLWERYTKHYE